MREKFLAGVAAGALIVGLAGPVAAADLPLAPRVYTKAPLPVGCDWCGFYLGGHVGYGRAGQDGALTSDTEGAAAIPPLQTSNLQMRGLVAGVHAGYNWVFNQRYVFGIEGDVSGLPGWQDKLTGSNLNNGGNGSLYAAARFDWLASIRGRLGMTFDRTLIYATGGVAWAHGNYTFGSSSPAQDAKFNFTKTGWVAGGGVEWKYNPNLILRLEGLYYRFDYNTGPIVTGDGNGATDFSKLKDVGVVRVGASYLFGPPS